MRWPREIIKSGKFSLYLSLNMVICKHIENLDWNFFKFFFYNFRMESQIPSYWTLCSFEEKKNHKEILDWSIFKI